MDYLKIQQQLNKLGANPQLIADGIYGAKTLAAIKAFQSSRGLVPDGVVGPKTLAALGLSSAVATSSGGGVSTMGQAVPLSPTIQKYYEIAKRAAAQAGMTEKQFQYAFTVAMGEGGFGEGWKRPSADTIAKSQQFGLTGYEGADSNNWGATQGSGDAGSFPHVDSHADGSLYVGNYKRWSTPEKGFLDVAKVILGGGKRGAVGAADIKAAIEAGNLRKAVFAQRANGYFELAPEKYLDAVKRNYDRLTSGTGWSKLMAENGVKAGIGLFSLIVLGGLGYAAYRFKGGL